MPSTGVLLESLVFVNPQPSGRVWPMARRRRMEPPSVEAAGLGAQVAELTRASASRSASESGVSSH